MDSFLTALFILVVSAVATWFKQRAARGDGDSPSGGPQTPPSNQPRQAPPQRTSWEEELRRLLEGDRPAAPPPMRPPPPLVTRPSPQMSRPAPTPPVVIRPVLVTPRRAVDVQSPEPVPLAVPQVAGGEASVTKSSRLEESKAAYQRASQLDKSVAEHIDRVPGQRVLATSVVRRAASAEAVQAVAMFKSARTVRQAVIVSLILGPPRSLEELKPIY